MTDQIQQLRPVLTRPESDFGKLLGSVLSPSRPLRSEELLSGRTKQLAVIKKALYQRGRHVLIHGFRGVGKSSLAQTAAYSLAGENQPVIVGCDSGSTFKSVMKDILSEVSDFKPNVDKRISEVGGGFSLGIFGNAKRTTEENAPQEPFSVNEAVRLIKFLTENYAENMVIVIDEFDQIKEDSHQRAFASFVKQVSDKQVPARFIFCGIAENVEDIMSAHGSADRYFHTVELGQLPWEARFDIVTTAADQLGIEVDENSVIRIARISDGFPHYVHLISEKLFWQVFSHRDKTGGKVNGDLFEAAMSDAAGSMEMKLRGPYETATQKYSNDYEHVLWATADGHELKRRSIDIYESYERIVQSLQVESLDRERFNQRINALKRQNYAEILTGSRQGWYEFTEKVVRGYVRLKAEQAGVVLEHDHPAVSNRITRY